MSRSAATTRLIVCIVELDRFAALRARVGYRVANALVGECAARVRSVIAGCDLGRIGRTGIEFAFNAAPRDDVEALLRRVVAAIERPFRIGDVDFDLTATIGAVDSGGLDIDDGMLDAVALALRAAQEAHDKVRIHTPASTEAGGWNDLTLLGDLHHALREDTLTLHYQPKLRCRSETIGSAEALLRWDHPTLGAMRTDRLIELAEATGAIRALTVWVIDRALADRAALAEAGHPLTIFVNISALVLPDTSFADWALERLSAYTGAIGFEITETAVIEDPTVAIRNLNRFAAAGIRIAIDDYGSGLSSLAYLKQLPAHELKIDRMFVQGLTETQRDPLLVRSSIDLAHALEMEVTAEGVDDQMSLSLLRVMGCDMVQGYLIARPLPLDELRVFLAEDRHRSALDATAGALAGWDLTAQG